MAVLIKHVIDAWRVFGCVRTKDRFPGFISKLKVNPNGLWTEIRVGVLSSSYEGRKIQE